MAPAKPSITERARSALQYFRTGRLSPKARNPLLWPTWTQGVPQWHLLDLDTYSREGFAGNSLIYSAIMYKARAQMAAPLTAYTGDDEHKVKLPRTDPLQALLRRPNDSMSWPEFQALMTVFLNLAGNAYAVKVDPITSDGLPSKILPLRPDRIFIVPGESNKIKGYFYVPEGRSIRDGTPILAEDVIHVKFPNPLDALDGYGYGLSPLAPMAQSVDVDNHVTKFLKLFFERGTMLTGLLKFETDMSPEDIQTVKERWKQLYGGSDNWAEEIGVLGKGGEYQRISPTFTEMGFEVIDDRSEARILGPFGVPPILVGARSADTNYSVYFEARRAFWEDTQTPELTLFAGEYDNGLAPDLETILAFDTSNVPAMKKDLVGLVSAAYQLFQMGVPPNTALPHVGIDLKVPGGDVGFVSLGLVPLNADTAEAMEDALEAASEPAPAPALNTGPRPEGRPESDSGADAILPGDEASPGAAAGQLARRAGIIRKARQNELARRTVSVMEAAVKLLQSGDDAPKS